MPVIAKRSDLWLMSGVLVLLLLAPAVPGYLYFSYDPVTDDQLARVHGRLKSWKENTLGRRRDSLPGRRSDLHIRIQEDDNLYVVGEDLYHASEKFNAAGFKQDVGVGDELVITVLRKELSPGLPRDVYGLSSRDVTYLAAGHASAEDEAGHRKMFSIMLAMLLVCPLIGYVMGREIQQYLKGAPGSTGTGSR